MQNCFRFLALVSRNLGGKIEFGFQALITSSKIVQAAVPLFLKTSEIGTVLPRFQMIRQGTS